MTKDESIRFQPIGVVHSPFRDAVGTPIQGVYAPDVEGVVEIFPEFEEGLQDTELFTHLVLLYAFHRVEATKLSCVPFLDDKERGVFATRAPSRPNPIGLSIVQVVAREGRHIRVRELDILDGTPLLDIKPYVPSCDCRADAGSGWLRDIEDRPAKRTADDRFTR